MLLIKLKGSDYTVFIAHLGIPSFDFSFRNNYTGATYHSVTDDFFWENRFGSFGRTYEYHVALAQIMGLSLIGKNKKVFLFFLSVCCL